MPLKKQRRTVIAVTVALLSCSFAASAWAHTPVESVTFSDWHGRLDVLFLIFLFGGIFIAGWLRLRARSALVVSVWQLLSYLAGLGMICLALLSPIDALSSILFTLHMTQHLLLLMMAPLFLLLANPMPAFIWGIPTKLRLSLGRLLTRRSYARRALWALTFMPVTWSVYVIDLWAWHYPLLYQLALKNSRVHDLEHLLFFFTALLFWWPIVNPAPRLHGIKSYGYQIVYLVAATLQNTLLGMAIAIPERILYPFYALVPHPQDFSPINDQALGGGIMWTSGHMYLIPILVLLARMLAHEDKIHGAARPFREVNPPEGVLQDGMGKSG